MIAFEPLSRVHLTLLREWLVCEHVRRWWRDPDESLGHAEEALAGVDPLIGEEDAIGRASRREPWRSSRARWYSLDRRHGRASPSVEEANRRSWRAFEKAGFRHVRDVEEDGLPHRLMQLERRYAQ